VRVLGVGYMGVGEVDTCWKTGAPLAFSVIPFPTLEMQLEHRLLDYGPMRETTTMLEHVMKKKEERRSGGNTAGGNGGGNIRSWRAGCQVFCQNNDD